MFKTTSQSIHLASLARPTKAPPGASGAPALAGRSTRPTSSPRPRPNDELPCWPLYALWYPHTPW